MKCSLQNIELKLVYDKMVHFKKHIFKITCEIMKISEIPHAKVPPGKPSLVVHWVAGLAEWTKKDSPKMLQPLTGWGGVFHLSI